MVSTHIRLLGASRMGKYVTDALHPAFRYAELACDIKQQVSMCCMILIIHQQTSVILCIRHRQATKRQHGRERMLISMDTCVEAGAASCRPRVQLRTSQYRDFGLICVFNPSNNRQSLLPLSQEVCKMPAQGSLPHLCQYPTSMPVSWKVEGRVQSH